MKDIQIANTAIAYALARQMKMRNMDAQAFAFYSKVPLRIIKYILESKIIITVIDAEKLEVATGIPKGWWVENSQILSRSASKPCVKCNKKG